jgi:hypothetical protein
MPQKRYRSRVALLLGSVLILSFGGLLFLPELVSTYWHLRYGDSTAFRGWRVPVPKGWYGVTRNDQLIIQKLLRFYENGDAPTIIPEVLSPSKTVNPEALKEASIRAISKKGYVFQGERPIQIGTDPGYCLHFMTGKDQKSIRISCDSLSAHLAVHLFGPSSEVQTFYSVVGQIRRE